MFSDKCILVVGGTGSLGKTLVDRLMLGRYGVPRKVIVFSRDEAKQQDMRIGYLRRMAQSNETISQDLLKALEFRIGDVLNLYDLHSAVRGADVVINAAAMKQVPTCEYFPEQAVATNCIGVANLVKAIEHSPRRIETLVTLSTDKACKPVNVMGMTKAIQERIVITSNLRNPGTRAVCVRYGNVLASRGSVVPLFHQQIRNGWPVTITQPDMTRFLMTLDQAADTVIEAIRSANPGETYIPRVPATTILNVAKAIIGGRNIEIQHTGIRPGEKLHEVLVSEEEKSRCIERGSYYVIKPQLPELVSEVQGESTLSGEFSSASNVLSLAETIELLRENHLLYNQAEELTRDFLNQGHTQANFFDPSYIKKKIRSDEISEKPPAKTAMKSPQVFRDMASKYTEDELSESLFP